MASVILGLSLNFYTRTNVNFTRVNKIQAMYGRSRVSVKVERGSTFTFTRGVSYITSISFTHVKFTCVRKENYVTVQINPYSAERGERRSPTRNTRDEHSARDRRKEK